MTMVNGGLLLLHVLSFLFIFLLLCFFSESRSLLSSNPLQFHPFKIKLNQTLASRCSYSVGIKTSCDSPSSTRDKVSLAFGDAHGNEVYAPKLDDPRSKIFERCSSDTFEIKGPCTHDICYLNLLRVGPDGWMPETVKIFYGGADPRRALTFTYNKFLPNGVWFGFNHCNRNMPNVLFMLLFTNVCDSASFLAAAIINLFICGGLMRSFLKCKQPIVVVKNKI